MKKLMLFPYTQKAYSFVQYGQSLEDIEIGALVQMKGWGRLGETFRCRGKDLSVSEDIDGGLSKCDVLCVLPTNIKIEKEKYLFPVIKKAVSLNKEVWIFTVLTNDEKDQLRQVNADGLIRFFGEVQPHLGAKFVSSDTPVIAVGSTVPNCEKWSVQLSMKKAFEDLGYKILLIGSHKEAFLYGGYCIPDYIFGKALTETEKIKSFNFFVNSLIATEEPDLVLLGLPGCALSFEPDLVEDFGLTAFEISQAVAIDEIVLCVTADRNDESFFESMGKIVNTRLGAPVCAFHVAPCTLDITYMMENNTVSYLNLDRAFVEKLVSDFDMPNVLDLTRAESAESICRQIIGRYGEYGDVQAQS